MSSLEDCKPGDFLAVTAGWSGSFAKKTVDRVTKTMIVDNTGVKWRKSDGHRIGGRPHAQNRIAIWTKDHDKRLAERKAESEWRMATHKLYEIRYSQLPLDKRDEAAVLIKQLISLIQKEES
jgi:hypothetical protein